MQAADKKDKACAALFALILLTCRPSLSREAKMLGVLNRPIIAAIYAVEDRRW